jgi:N-acetylglucosamine kinase-like BadF-type ATPase
VILIAQSSSTKTEWALIDKQGAAEYFVTDGINPIFQTRIEISRIIRLQLPPVFFLTRPNKIYFYGVGCSSIKLKTIVKTPLETQLRGAAIVENNLEGAARALFQNDRGIACILDTESNSCFYNGTSIVKNVRSLGYILGDEGGGASLGKTFLSDCLQNIAPADLIERFYLKNKIDPDEILNYIYTNPFSNRILSTISYFLYENIDHPYVYKLVCNNLRTFLERNIFQYDNYSNYPIRFIGPIAKIYSSILREVAQSIGIYIDIIIESPMKGLVKYHTR